MTTSKTKGRIARTPVDVVDATADLDQPRIENAMVAMQQTAIAAQEAAAQRDTLVRAVAAQMGYSLPADATDPDLIQRDISANMRRSVEACLEVGRGLAVLKTACEHGQFVGRVEVLGIDYTVATRFMQAAAKFSNVATSQPLLKAAGTQSKLFELLVLDDDQVEELALTGQTGELALDDVASMTVKELRAAVREARADLTAKDEVLATKNKKIDELHAAKRRIARATPDEKLADLKKEATQCGFDAQAAVTGNLRLALQALRDHDDEAGTQGGNDLFMAGLVGAVAADLTRLRAAFGLPDVSAAVDQALAADVAAWADDKPGPVVKA